MMKITKIKILLLVVIMVITTNSVVAQTVAGYSFDKYPAKEIYKGPKAALKIDDIGQGSDYWRKTKADYKKYKIDFAGKYTVLLRSAGAGLSVGEMVDNKTGVMYDMPMTEENASRNNCGIDYVKSNLIYNKNSNLLICYTWTCQDNDDGKTTVITRYYSIFLWDEAKKKFKLIKEKEVSYTEKL